MVYPVNKEGWPTLLTLEAACRYLSLEMAPFLRLANRWRVLPIDLGEDQQLWRRGDLEQIANAVTARLSAKGLGAKSEPLRLFSAPEAARQLGIGRSTVYRMIKDGTLEVRKIGHRTMITSQSINALIDP